MNCDGESPEPNAPVVMSGYLCRYTPTWLRIRMIDDSARRTHVMTVRSGGALCERAMDNTLVSAMAKGGRCSKA